MMPATFIRAPTLPSVQPIASVRRAAADYQSPSADALGDFPAHGLNMRIWSADSATGFFGGTNSSLTVCSDFSCSASISRARSIRQRKRSQASTSMP